MIWGLITGWIVKRGVMIGIVAAITAGIALWDHKRANRHRAEGQKQVVQASKKEGRKRNEKVREIRRRISPNDAWDRLREEYGNRN